MHNADSNKSGSSTDKNQPSSSSPVQKGDANQGSAKGHETNQASGQKGSTDGTHDRKPGQTAGGADSQKTEKTDPNQPSKSTDKGRPQI